MQARQGNRGVRRSPTRVANVVPAGTARGIRAIPGVRVRLSRSPPVLELEFSPCRGFRVMPTNGAKLSDQEGCNEGLAETQEARKEACAEDARGTTNRKVRRRQACQPGARRLTGRPYPQADRGVGTRALGARLGSGSRGHRPRALGLVARMRGERAIAAFYRVRRAATRKRHATTQRPRPPGRKSQ